MRRPVAEPVFLVALTVPVQTRRGCPLSALRKRASQSRVLFWADTGRFARPVVNTLHCALDFIICAFHRAVRGDCALWVHSAGPDVQLGGNRDPNFEDFASRNSHRRGVWWLRWYGGWSPPLYDSTKARSPRRPGDDGFGNYALDLSQRRTGVTKPILTLLQAARQPCSARTSVGAVPASSGTGTSVWHGHRRCSRPPVDRSLTAVHGRRCRDAAGVVPVRRVRSPRLLLPMRCSNQPCSRCWR